MFNLIIIGIIDGLLFGGFLKAIELYVLVDIVDFSMYGIEVVINGNVSIGLEFIFFGFVMVGDYIYVVSEILGFNSFFGFNFNFIDGVVNINGDDIIIFFENGLIVDVFGEIGIDGIGRFWEYFDGWVYCNNGVFLSSIFNVFEWIFSGVDVLDDDVVNVNVIVILFWSIVSFSVGGINGLDLFIYVCIGCYDFFVFIWIVVFFVGSELVLEVFVIIYNFDINIFFVLGDEGMAIVEIDK